MAHKLDLHPSIHCSFYCPAHPCKEVKKKPCEEEEQRDGKVFVLDVEAECAKRKPSNKTGSSSGAFEGAKGRNVCRRCEVWPVGGG